MISKPMLSHMKVSKLPGIVRYIGVMLAMTRRESGRLEEDQMRLEVSSGLMISQER